MESQLQNFGQLKGPGSTPKRRRSLTQWRRAFDAFGLPHGTLCTGLSRTGRTSGVFMQEKRVWRPRWYKLFTWPRIWQQVCRTSCAEGNMITPRTIQPSEDQWPDVWRTRVSPMCQRSTHLRSGFTPPCANVRSGWRCAGPRSCFSHTARLADASAADAADESARGCGDVGRHVRMTAIAMEVVPAESGAVSSGEVPLADSRQGVPLLESEARPEVLLCALCQQQGTATHCLTCDRGCCWRCLSTCGRCGAVNCEQHAAEHDDWCPAIR